MYCMFYTNASFNLGCTLENLEGFGKNGEAGEERQDCQGPPGLVMSLRNWSQLLHSLSLKRDVLHTLSRTHTHTHHHPLTNVHILKGYRYLQAHPPPSASHSNAHTELNTRTQVTIFSLQLKQMLSSKPRLTHTQHTQAYPHTLHPISLSHTDSCTHLLREYTVPQTHPLT